MKSYLKLAVLPMVGLLAACGNYDLDAVSSMPNSGSSFDKSLQAEYVQLAIAEDDEHDWDDAEFFAMKAAAVAKGEAVGPQEVSERALNAKHSARAGVERSTLVSLLTPENKSAHPADAAKAQAMFDCYLQEAEENNQPEHVEACLKAYEEALRKLDSIKRFIVYFDFNSAELNPKALGVIGPVAEMAKSGGMSVTLSGHTDTVGDPTYNKALSKARVMAVEKALMGDGVMGSKISTDYFGEAQQKVKTQDNVKAALNRRVEIAIK